jgi:hypothetical protein
MRTRLTLAGRARGRRTPASWALPQGRPVGSPLPILPDQFGILDPTARTADCWTPTNPLD